jgi:mRNA interferase RelE/StbE
VPKPKQKPSISPPTPAKPTVYEVRYHLAAEKQLLDIPNPYRAQLARRISNLKNDPRSQASKLVGVDLYKVRQGDYRAIFAIEDETVVVLVVKVGHRREVYGKVKELAKSLGR